MLPLYVHVPDAPQNVLRDTDGDLFVIVPEATTNLITNPSFERDLTGYAKNESFTLARTPLYQRFGTYAMQISPISLNSVVYTSVTLTANQPYTFSLWLYGIAGRSYTITFANSSTFAVRAATSVRATGRWQHVYVTYQPVASETVILTLKSDTSTASFLSDAWQLEAKAYPTTFCDGSQAGCRWVGLEHASQSTRLATEPSGGRMRSFNAVFYLSLLAITGLASLTFNPVTVPLAAGGARYYESRLDTTQFHVVGNLSADSASQRDARLSTIRTALSPFARKTGTPVYLVWQPKDRGEPSGDGVTIPAVWDPDTTEVGVFTHTPVDLSFHLYLPMLLGYDQASILGSSGSLQNPVYLAWRNINGAWSKITPYVIDTSFGGSGYASAETFAVIDAPQGGVYIASRHQFGTSSASSTLIHFDGTTYSLIGGKTLFCGAPVRTIVTDAQGNLYAGGEFGTGLHASSPNIARFNRATNTWQPVSSGANGAVYSIIIGPNGLVYVGGQFTSIGGVAVNGIAVYDPQANSFSKLANTGLSSGTAQTLAFDPTANILYVGGIFAGVSGVANSQNIAMYNTLTKTWQSMGNATDSPGLGVTVLQVINGYLYLGGDVRTVNGITISGFGRWNGSQWRAEGNFPIGYDTAVHAITLDDDGFMLVGGSLTTTDGQFYTNPVLRWNGTRWLSADYGYNPMIRSISRTNLGLFLGAWVINSNTLSSVLVSTSTNLTNTGTMDAKPTITITNPMSTPGSLWWIGNRTRDQHLFFNYTLAPGETLTLDTLQNTSRSSLFGTVYPIIGGDLASFALSPGVNTIAVQAYTLGISLQWKESFLSLQDSVWERGR